MASFEELEQAEQVTFVVLSATLREYVEGGWAVNPKVVQAIARRVQMTGTGALVLAGLAADGARVQEARGCATAAGEYRALMHMMCS